METLCALIRGDLAPAGNKISLAVDPAAFAYPVANYHATWVDSGTSALALALLDAKQKAPHIKNPQVIIPGYCCPDLVAAAVYAGVRPLAVDIGEADAGYDLAQLKTALSENTLAVIAVNFLGVKERLADIRGLLANTRIRLIEDNAQWFPASANEHGFASDYLVFTFGRGKPLSLLGGGVLFSRETIAVADAVAPAGDSAQDLKLRGKLMAYNLLLHPRCYCYLNRAPFLQLGETAYHKLTEISALDGYRKALFAANLQLHSARNHRVEQACDKIFADTGIQHLAAINDSHRRARLLRYPLLCTTAEMRALLLSQLAAAGLGASPMYQRAIAEIPGVEAYIDVAADLKNARQFALRFLTLPTHEYVSAKHIQRIKQIVDSVNSAQ